MVRSTQGARPRCRQHMAPSGIISLRASQQPLFMDTRHRTVKMPLGGRLVLKGQPVKDKKKKKKRSRDDAEEKPYDGKTTEGKEEERDEPEEPAKTPDPEAGLTEAQKRHLAKLRQREAERIKKIVGQTHRERVEEFNNYLASLTEHNDIPRVSAAGNG